MYDNFVDSRFGKINTYEARAIYFRYEYLFFLKILFLIILGIYLLYLCINLYLFLDISAKNDIINPTDLVNVTTTNRKLLNKQSKNLSTYGFESLDIVVSDHKYNKVIVTTKNTSTQTGNISIVERNERQVITRPKTAKINR